MADDETNSSGGDFKILGFGVLGFSVLVTLFVHVLCWFLVIGIYWIWIFHILILVCFAIIIATTFLPKKIATIVQPLMAFSVVLLNFLTFWFGTRQFMVNSGLKLSDPLPLLNKENVVFVFFKDTGKPKDSDELTIDIKKIEKTFDDQVKEKSKQFMQKKKTENADKASIKLDDNVESKADAAAIWKMLSKKRYVSIIKRGTIEIELKGSKEAIGEKGALNESEFSQLYEKRTGKALVNDAQ